MNYCSLVYKEYEQDKHNLQCGRLYKENSRDFYIA